MAHDEYMKEIIRGPVRDGERALIDGALGRDMIRFVREMKGGAPVTLNHLDQFFNIANTLRGASRIIAAKESQDVWVANGAMVGTSHVSTATIGVIQAPRGEKKFYTLEHFSAVARPEGMLAIIRPYPIQWLMDHIDHRNTERHGGFDAQSDRFHLHNNVIMMMLQIIEEEHFDGKNTHIPFLLPEGNGVLVGHTMAMLAGREGNRIFMAAAKDEARLNLSPYAWFPKLEATVRTFLGPDEMTPAMKQLRMQLLKFYSPPYRAALEIGLENYTRTIGCSSYEDHPQRDRFEEALIGIADIMASPLWRNNVRLPVHLQGGKGLKNDHP